MISSNNTNFIKLGITSLKNYLRKNSSDNKIEIKQNILNIVIDLLSETNEKSIIVKYIN